MRAMQSCDGACNASSIVISADKSTQAEDLSQRHTIQEQCATVCAIGDVIGDRQEQRHVQVHILTNAHVRVGDATRLTTAALSCS